MSHSIAANRIDQMTQHVPLDRSLEQLNALTDKIKRTRDCLVESTAAGKQWTSSNSISSATFSICSQTMMDVAIGSETDLCETQYQELESKVYEELNRLQQEKTSLEKQLRRQSVNFKSLSEERDETIQKEYNRQLDVLDEELHDLRTHEQAERQSIKKLQLQVHHSQEQLQLASVMTPKTTMSDVKSKLNEKVQIIQSLQAQYRQQQEQKETHHAKERSSQRHVRSQMQQLQKEIELLQIHCLESSDEQRKQKLKLEQSDIQASIEQNTFRWTNLQDAEDNAKTQLTSLCRKFSPSDSTTIGAEVSRILTIVLQQPQVSLDDLIQECGGSTQEALTYLIDIQALQWHDALNCVSLAQ